MKKITAIVRYPGDMSLTLIEEVDENLTPEDILELVFAWCNNGSGREHNKFINMRSMSSNDLVCLESVGWQRVTNEYVTEIEEEVKKRMGYGHSKIQNITTSGIKFHD